MTCCYLECVLLPKETDSNDEEPLIQYEGSAKGKRLRCSVPTPPRARRWICAVWTHKYFRRCRKITLIMIVLLLLLALLTMFVGIPVTFMLNVTWQRSMIFNPRVYPPKPTNMYATVNKRENISLGVWHIPYDDTSHPARYPYYYGYNLPSSNLSLMSDNTPAILYFHRETEDRSSYQDIYTELRKVFHVVTFDYRSYGDSSKAELIEEGMVQDCVELYKWLRTKTSADIYVWGDTLGAAIATHTISRLRDENIAPRGLVLQNPYTALKDQFVYYWPTMTKVFSWLPWYKVTMLDSLERNGFGFKTSKHILKVDCPIMIISFESNVVPYHFGVELSKMATENRDPVTQGNVTMKLVPWPEFPDNIPIYMSDFLKICKAYNNGRV